MEFDEKDLGKVLDRVEGLAGEWKELRSNIGELTEERDEQIAATGQKAERLAENLKAVTTRADEIEGKLDEALEGLARIETIQKQVDEMDAESKKGRLHGGGSERKTLGQMFVESEAAASLAGQRKGDTRAAMEVTERPLLPPRTKTLLTSTATDNLIVPEEAGLVAALERRLRIRDLMPVNPTSSDAIRYIRELGFYGAGDTGLSITGIVNDAPTDVATATTAAAHGLRAGDSVKIEGANQEEYNGVKTIIDVPSTTTFDFATTGDPTTPATGTITYTVLESGGAAGTWAETNTKAEATLELDEVLAEIRTIAHWLPVTRQVIDDRPALRAYIDNRLLYGLLFEEERQILYGSGSAPDLEGLLVNPDRQRLSQADLTNADKVATILEAAVRAAVAEFEPSGIVMSWGDWKDVINARVNAGTDDRFIHGSPVGRGSGPRDVDGTPVLVTSAINDGQALVGDFEMGAALWDRESGMIRVSDSHSDFFIKNQLAILAEERVGLSVFRPRAFVDVTFS